MAGIGVGGPIHKMEMSDYDKVMDVDLRGVFLGMKYGIPRLREAGGGAIVNWSSVGGLHASEQAMATSVYNAAKAGVVSLTKSASAEYGRKGIRVNCVCPGFIETEIMGAAGGARLPRDREEGVARSRRAARGGRRSGGVPVLGSCVVRLGRDHPGRRRLVRAASVTGTP